MVGDRHPRAGCCCGDATVETTQRDQVLGLRAADRRTGSVLEELPQVPGVAGSCVQGIVPRRLAAISLRSAGSQTRTVSAWASATSAVIAAGLGATTWWRSSRDALPRSLQARSQRRDFGVSPTLPTKDGAFTFRRLRPQALVRH